MITILGGGIVGATLARALALRGRRDVVVFDPNPPASGSTGRATGGFRTQFVNPINIALSLASRPFFVERAKFIGFKPVGYLYPADNAAYARELRLRAEVQRAAGLPITHPDVPALMPYWDASGIITSNYCALDGTFTPAALLQCVVEEARAAGAQFRYLHTAGPADLEAEMVVIATGIWTTAVAAQLGLDLRITPKQRAVHVFKPQGLPSLDTMPYVLDAGNGWAVRERAGLLLAVPPDDNFNWQRVRDWLQGRLPAARFGAPEDVWTGSYEMSFDEHPLAGPTRRPGVWACCGFSGHGVMHSPAMAESMADMMLGNTPRIDISAFDPHRTAALSETVQP